MLYINGSLCTHGIIAGLINNCRCSFFSENCSFEERYNDKNFIMKMKASRFVFSDVIHSLYPSDELLITYNLCKPPITPQRFLALGLEL